MNKICPLIYYRDNDSRMWCAKENCAWWNEEQACCSIVAEKNIKPITCTTTSGNPYGYIPTSSVC